jgi:hypothetical protein
LGPVGRSQSAKANRTESAAWVGVSACFSEPEHGAALSLSAIVSRG